MTDPRESPFAVIFLKTPAMAATQLGFTHGAMTRETSVTIVAIATSLNFNVHMLWNLSNLHQFAIVYINYLDFFTKSSSRLKHVESKVSGR